METDMAHGLRNCNVLTCVGLDGVFLGAPANNFAAACSYAAHAPGIPHAHGRSPRGGRTSYPHWLKSQLRRSLGKTVASRRIFHRRDHCTQPATAHLEDARSNNLSRLAPGRLPLRHPAKARSLRTAPAFR